MEQEGHGAALQGAGGGSAVGEWPLPHSVGGVSAGYFFPGQYAIKQRLDMVFLISKPGQHTALMC